MRNRAGRPQGVQQEFRLGPRKETPSDFGELLEDKDWLPIELDPNQRIWTDDYSNVVGAIVRNLRKHHASTSEE